MQTNYEAEQLSMFGQDLWYGKMFPAPLVQERQRAKTSESFWRRSSALSAVPFMSLDLTPGHGNLLGESYWELISPWLGGAWMLNTGVSPNDARGSSLSQILQDAPPIKYYLSPKACLGILRRASERGKALQPKLGRALKIQAGLMCPAVPPAAINTHSAMVFTPSSTVYGQTNIGGKGGTRIPIAGIAGDQQAALFGHLCVENGMAKNTYGTGCFMLMNTGKTAVSSKNGLITTLACGPRGEACYALEGSIFVGGSAIQWLRDELKIVNDARDTEYFANKAETSNDVYVIPAFTGLGAPYWDPYARGAIVGLTRGTNASHIIRATLESLAYQSMDVLRAMEEDLGIRIDSLKADGGASRNGFLMQFQSDLLDVEVVCPDVAETTALGAAALAGLAVGFWKDQDEIRRLTQHVRLFHPQMGEEEREKLTKGWKKAVAAAAAFDVV